MKIYIKTILSFCLVGLLISCNSKSTEVSKNKLELKIGGYDYDRVQPIKNGEVTLKDATVSFEKSNIYALNRYAFGPDQKFDITEMGLIPYITKYINEDFREYTLIPVFISKVFRHKNIFVHVDSGIEKPEDLKGKRVGTPGYGMSSHTWIRGLLLDEYGIKADDFSWIESAKSSDGGKINKDFAKYFFREDFPLSQGPEGVDESELLLSGGCDALITAITPKAYLDGNPKIKRLFTNVKEAEIAYYKKTGMFPIMHVVAIKTKTLEENPWLAEAVFNMYSEAKNKTYASLESTTVSKVTLPWLTDEFESTKELMGDNFWPYGIEANRKELEAIMRYVYEQGLTKEQIGFEEMFDTSTLGLVEK